MLAALCLLVQTMRCERGKSSQLGGDFSYRGREAPTSRTFELVYRPRQRRYLFLALGEPQRKFGPFFHDRLDLALALGHPLGAETRVACGANAVGCLTQQ